MELTTFNTYTVADIIKLLAEMDGLDWSEFHLKNCNNCNKEFITKQNRKKFCSEDCRLGKVVEKVPERKPVEVVAVPELDEIDKEIEAEENYEHKKWLRKYRRLITNWDEVKHKAKYMLRLGYVESDGRWTKPYPSDVSAYEMAHPDEE